MSCTALGATAQVVPVPRWGAVRHVRMPASHERPVEPVPPGSVDPRACVEGLKGDPDLFGNLGRRMAAAKKA